MVRLNSVTLPDSVIIYKSRNLMVRLNPGEGDNNEQYLQKKNFAENTSTKVEI